jgi:uncharacterized membrane protein
MFAYRSVLALHIISNMVWIGSIVSVALILSASGIATPRERAKIALAPYRYLAVPAFLLSLATGITCLVLDPSRSLLKIPSMHVKLTLALGVILIHHWIGISARKMVSGRIESSLPVAIVVALFVSACGAAWLGVVKPF